MIKPVSFRTALLVLTLLLQSNIATAAVQTYVREYTYQASEADSKLSARAIALQEVKRILLSELGTHVSSLVQMKTSSDGTRLSTEEIETLSAGVVHVDILSEKWDGVTYVLKAQIKADPEDVLKSLNDMLDASKKQKRITALEGDLTKMRMANINVSEALKQSRKETDAALAEIARLKQQLAQKQTTATQQTLQAEYKKQVDVVTLQEWFDVANSYYQKKDYKQAFNLFHKAAEQGYAEAQFSIGVMYANGEGVTRDSKQAVYWYQKAAKQSVAKAQYNLGAMYHKGDGVQKNEAQAISWYRKAAEQGLPDAEMNLGLRYDYGLGVQKDNIQAAYWYKRAAENDLAEAQYFIATMYDTGTGVSKDAQQAAIWYRKAAEQGYAEAQYALGNVYQTGQGAHQDYDQAQFWYSKAADQGNSSAQLNLGIMYVKGQGASQNLALAYFWINLSAEQGNVNALKNRELLKGILSPKQMDEAKNLSRNHLNQ